MLAAPFLSLLGGKEEEKKKVEKPSPKKLEVSENETINIFSIASGHLYERFLRSANSCCPSEELSSVSTFPPSGS